MATLDEMLLKGLYPLRPDSFRPVGRGRRSAASPPTASRPAGCLLPIGLHFGRGGTIWRQRGRFLIGSKCGHATVPGKMRKASPETVKSLYDMDVEEKTRRREEFFELFKRSGWTQAETARELGGVSRANINGIITGKQTPGAALLDLFRVRVEQMEHQSGHPNATAKPQDVTPESKVDYLIFELEKLRENVMALERAARLLKPAGSGRSAKHKHRRSGQCAASADGR